MIHLTVLEELRKVQPNTLTAGQLLGRLLEDDNIPGPQFVNRQEILSALAQLRSTGMVEEVTGVGVGPSEWRAKS